MKKNDLITINNLNNNEINLALNNIKQDIIFYNNKNFVKINYSLNNDNYNKLDKYEDQYIYIYEVESKNNIIGNIPLDLLKGLFKIYFNVDLNDNKISDNNYNDNYFYIQLPIKYFNKEKINLKNEDLLIKFNFQNIGGININKINFNINNYHKIENIINKNQFQIKLINNSSSKYKGGNSNIILKKIKYIIYGYPEQSNYKIKFESTLYNIKEINVLESSIPHSEYNITNKNNKLYFKILNDNNILRKIEIKEGLYNLEFLIKNIINEFNKISLKNNIINDENSNFTYNNLYIDIDYSINNNIIEFRLYNNIEITIRLLVYVKIDL